MNSDLPASDSLSEESTPVCYRHPERIAYVSCQRCARHICPECQTPSSVGVLCPDDAKEAAANTPVTRTIFGGVFRQGPPVATFTLIVLCVIAYVGEWVPSLALVQRWVLVPSLVGFEPWRLLTNAFLHSPENILHIALNMYMLWMVGQALEPMLGRLRFVVTYLVCALGGSAGVILLASPTSASWNTATLGASGAIFGMFGIMVLVQKKLGLDIKQIGALIAINLVFGVVVSGVSWQAHVGGLVVGLLLGAIVAYAPRAQQALYQLGGCLILTGILLIAIYAKVKLGVSV